MQSKLMTLTASPVIRASPFPTLHFFSLVLRQSVPSRPVALTVKDTLQSCWGVQHGSVFLPVTLHNPHRRKEGDAEAVIWNTIINVKWASAMPSLPITTCLKQLQIYREPSALWEFAMSNECRSCENSIYYHYMLRHARAGCFCVFSVFKVTGR